MKITTLEVHGRTYEFFPLVDDEGNRDEEARHNDTLDQEDMEFLYKQSSELPDVWKNRCILCFDWHEDMLGTPKTLWHGDDGTWYLSWRLSRYSPDLFVGRRIK